MSNRISVNVCIKIFCLYLANILNYIKVFLGPEGAYKGELKS